MNLGKVIREVLLVAIGVLVSEAAFCGESEDAVVNEIVAAHEKLRNEFRPTKVIQSFEEIDAPGEDKVARRPEFLYRNDNVLVITELVVDGANDEYAFRIRRATPDSDWTIASVEAASGTGPSTSRSLSITLSQDPLSSFLDANHIPIDEFLTSSNTRVASLSDIERDGERHVEIELQVLDPNAKLKNGVEFIFTRGVFTFRPDSVGWIPEKIEMIRRENTVKTVISSDFVPMGEFVIPMKYRVFERNAAGQQHETVNGHTEFGFDEIPEERFFLSYYGLPEPTFGMAPSSMRLWWFLAGATLLVLGFALVLYRRFSA